MTDWRALCNRVKDASCLFPDEIKELCDMLRLQGEEIEATKETLRTFFQKRDDADESWQNEIDALEEWCGYQWVDPLKP